MSKPYAAHGTDKRYNHGSGPDPDGQGAGPPCRERCCREAHNAAERARRRRTAYGRGMVDSGPAREHVVALRAQGMTVVRIAEKAGTSRNSLTCLVWAPKSGRPSPRRKIRAEFAARLLAVTPDPPGVPVGDRDHVLVSSIGSVRRLQALALLGWTGAQLAAELGMAQKNLLRLRSRGHDQVTVGIARRVAALYDRLWDTPPSPQTPTERAFMRRTIASARAAGWVPVAAFDDVDDPAATPVLDLPADRDGDPHVVDAFLAERLDWDRLRPADRHLLVRWCRRRGWTGPEIAARLGIETDALDYYFNQAKDAA